MPTTTLPSYSLTDTKNNFSAYTAEANRTGEPFVVKKQDKPWVKVVPMQADGSVDEIIVPVRKSVAVADIKQLFSEHPSDYVPVEDGFAAPVGAEVL